MQMTGSELQANKKYIIKLNTFLFFVSGIQKQIGMNITHSVPFFIMSLSMAALSQRQQCSGTPQKRHPLLSHLHN